MGCVETIRVEGGVLRFPEQSDWVGQRVRVYFHYDTQAGLIGTVVRDDKGPPHETLIAIDDGPILRAVECQHSLPLELGEPHRGGTSE